jgi:hypothetical protein
MPYHYDSSLPLIILPLNFLLFSTEWIECFLSYIVYFWLFNLFEMSSGGHTPIGDLTNAISGGQNASNSRLQLIDLKDCKRCLGMSMLSVAINSPAFS